MATSSITNATSAASSTAKTASDVAENKNTISDYDKFLLLLTTQMKNQDPTDPMNATEQMSQLAQFSTVEQQVKTNEKLESLLTMMTSNKLEDAASYLGKNVSFGIDELVWDGSTAPAFDYQTAATAKTALATVTNEHGAMIRTFEVPLSASSVKTATWDGKTDTGLSVPAGVYNISLKNIIDTADDTKNTNATLMSSGKVSSVEQNNGTFVLKLDSGKTVNITDIQRLSV